MTSIHIGGKSEGRRRRRGRNEDVSSIQGHQFIYTERQELLENFTGHTTWNHPAIEASQGLVHC